MSDPELWPLGARAAVGCPRGSHARGGYRRTEPAGLRLRPTGVNRAGDAANQ